jgi:glutaminyl-tRNA synthetase
VIDVSLLEFCVREDLNRRAERRMVVLDPLKAVITNYPEGQIEKLPAENNPEDKNTGHRDLSFSREIFIEREDFELNPPEGYNRLSPGGMVRLKHAFIIRCDETVINPDGSIKELHCTYFPESRSGQDKSGIKVKGVIHFVNAANAMDAEVRLYDRLFNVENPDAQEGSFLDYLNPDSLKVIYKAKVEPALKDAKTLDKFQFLRLGYFCVDKDSTSSHLIFNRTVTLKDAWGKAHKK